MFLLVAFTLGLLWVSYRLYRLNSWVPFRANNKPRAILITGCDTGFGYLLAKRLDKDGVKVFAGCLTEPGAQKLKSETSDQLVTLLMDVTKEESVKESYEKVKSLVGEDGLWAIVNNAGISEDFWMEFVPMKAYRKVLDVNYFGVVLVTKTFLPLVKRKKGRVVSIASIAGLLAMPGMSAYCSSKWAVEAFCESLRREMRMFGVKVVLIEPGFMRTPLVAGIGDTIKRKWNEAPESLRQEYGEDFYQRFIVKAIPRVEKITGDPETVVDALYSALFSEAPLNRYLVGKGTWIFKLISQLYSPIADIPLDLRTRQ